MNLESQTRGTRRLAMDRRGFLRLTGVATGAAAIGVGMYSAAPAAFGADGVATDPSVPSTLAPKYPGSPYSPGFFTENFENRNQHTYGNHVAFAKAFLEYDPATDPEARFFVCHVPMAKRIRPRRSTQARPALDPRPGTTELSLPYMPLSSDEARYVSTSGDYLVPKQHDERWNQHQCYRHTWSDDVYVPLQHSYRDIFGSWAPSWEMTTVMFNPAFADLAHRNGQLAIGIVHGPYMGPSVPVTDQERENARYSFVARDESGFVFARKLVEMAEYFGYDGFFLNFEARMDASQVVALKELIVFAKELARSKGLADFHIQWYDSLNDDGSISYHNAFTERNAKWLTDVPNDSIFLNYWWTGNKPLIDLSAAVAKKYNIDPFSRVYFGIEMENSRSQDPAKKWRAAEIVIPLNQENGETPKASIALFDPVQQLVTWSRSLAPSGNLPLLRKVTRYAECKFWSGPTLNPASPHQAGEDLGAADFFVERSVIGSIPFTTRFNIGSGKQFRLEGRDASALGAWSNAGIQDILPTWQWWVVPAETGWQGNLAEVEFDEDVAFDGPTSLRVEGTSDSGPSVVKLFKTEINPQPGAKALVVYRADQGTEVALGWTIGDAVENILWKPLTGAGSGWRTAEVEVPAAGPISSISLRVRSSIPGAPFSAHIGEFTIRASNAAPQTPSNFRLDGLLITPDITAADARVFWDLDPAVWHYQLTTDGPDGPIWLGRVSSNAYYLERIPRINNATSSTIHLTPVAHNGIAGAPASVTLPWVETPTPTATPTPTDSPTPSASATETPTPTTSPTPSASATAALVSPSNPATGSIDPNLPQPARQDLATTGVDGGQIIGLAAAGAGALLGGLLLRRSARAAGHHSSASQEEEEEPQ